MTKIDIISGFLGAGKTTLIKKLLKEAFQGEKLVLIENEFGEIGIDGGFLQESGVQVTEMNSGCICCSLVGDFGAALTEVIETYAPDRVIIEPSGVGKLSDVIKAVENLNLRTGIVLNSAAVVADAKKSRMYMKNFGEFFNNQIEHAGTIILSRTQDLKEDKLLACVKEIKEHNPHAVIITTPWDELSGDVILKEMENRNSLEQQLLEEEKVCETCGHHHDHHEHNHECSHDHHEHDHECNHEHNHECGHDHHEHSHKCNHDHGHHEHNHECNHEHHADEHHADEHHADEIFSSWGVETPQKFNQEALKNMLEKLTETDAYGIILRAKGMLQSEDGKWMYFDLVPGEYEVRDGLPQATGRICVIGSKIKNEEIAKLFGVA